MVTILIQVTFAARVPVGGVEGKTFDHILCHARGKATFACDHAQAVKGWVARGRSGECHRGQFAYRLQSRLRVRDSLHSAAMVLPIGHVIAFAAPCVEQPHALARRPVEQAAGEAKGFRPARDTLLRKGDECRAVEHHSSPYRGGVTGHPPSSGKSFCAAHRRPFGPTTRPDYHPQS